MIKFIFVGDPHARGTNPRNRKDEYKPALIEKLREIWQLAIVHQVQAILLAGDFFDLPDVANSVLNEFADVVQEAPCPVWTTAGNHDIPGYNIEAYPNTSLRLLERLVPQFHVINDPTDYVAFKDNKGTEVAVSFTPYSGKIDVNGWGYSPGTEPPSDYYKIHLAHGMLLDHTPPFDRFTLIQEVRTTADLVLTGHDHTGYGIYRRGDGKVFCNPGSLTRLSASESEIKRQIQVALIEVGLMDTQPSTGERLGAEIKLLPITCAKPGPDVLDRSKIEAETKRQYAMESFAALIQTSTGEKVLLDLNQIVDTIAEQEGFSPSVRGKALEKIEEARMQLST